MLNAIIAMTEILRVQFFVLVEDTELFLDILVVALLQVLYTGDRLHVLCAHTSSLAKLPTSS